MSKKKRLEAAMRRELRERKRELWRAYTLAETAARGPMVTKYPSDDGTTTTIYSGGTEEEIRAAKEQAARAHRTLATFSREVAKL